jgi:hypothetical protein
VAGAKAGSKVGCKCSPHHCPRTARQQLSSVFVSSWTRYKISSATSGGMPPRGMLTLPGIEGLVRSSSTHSLPPSRHFLAFRPHNHAFLPRSRSAGGADPLALSPATRSADRCTWRRSLAECRECREEAIRELFECLPNLSRFQLGWACHRHRLAGTQLERIPWRFLPPPDPQIGAHGGDRWPSVESVEKLPTRATRRRC